MWLISQRTLSVILLSLAMQTLIHTKPSDNLTFINLKTFINEHFETTPYIITVEHEDYLQYIADKQTTTGVFVEDGIIDCNLRLIDTYLPEYLLFIMQHGENNISLRQAIASAANVGLRHIPDELQTVFLERKMHHFIEAIIVGNLTKKVWHGEWQRDNCYVTKHNGELEYYTVYDYSRLCLDLLDWLQLSYTRVHNSYRLHLHLMNQI